MGIDHFSTLILSIYNNSVYTHLLGSGVSLEAKIILGWIVAKDFIKKVPMIQGEKTRECLHLV